MRKLKQIAVAAAILWCCTALLAADQDPQRTNGLHNGRYWNTVGFDLKVGYVVGFTEGMLAALVTGRETWEAYTCNGTIGEIVRGIDDIYAKPENGALPIKAAVNVFAMKVKGSSNAEIEARLATYRALYNSAVPEK